MPKKRKKDKKPHRPKVNSQIPISQVRKVTLESPVQVLRNARQYPILGCWIMEGWQESGITPVIIARQQDDEQVLYASYLVDLYCLGIKDVTIDVNVPQKRFERSLPKLCMQEPEAISVELAHEIVYGALEFAQKYGFEPHYDFTHLHADQVLDSPETHPRSHNVQFGKDGKPFFVPGPYDDERKIKHALQSLERTAGEGNFHFMVGFGDADFFGE
ncbi:MAG: hypothetical protein JW963_12845 [Anaerolineales bacterium]|nr:hypothetical protein [Anaerolineales bacterium]